MVFETRAKRTRTDSTLAAGGRPSSVVVAAATYARTRSCTIAATRVRALAHTSAAADVVATAVAAPPPPPPSHGRDADDNVARCPFIYFHPPVVREKKNCVGRAGFDATTAANWYYLLATINYRTRSSAYARARNNTNGRDEDRTPLSDPQPPVFVVQRHYRICARVYCCCCRRTRTRAATALSFLFGDDNDIRARFGADAGRYESRARALWIARGEAQNHKVLSHTLPLCRTVCRAGKRIPLSSTPFFFVVVVSERADVRKYTQIFKNAPFCASSFNKRFINAKNIRCNGTVVYLFFRVHDVQNNIRRFNVLVVVLNHECTWNLLQFCYTFSLYFITQYIYSS